MFWLRRIPKETRIVVVVVFLALFQAILLSAFGLTAIYNERDDAENRLRSNADSFLRWRIVDPAESELSRRAEIACTAAFDREDADWRTRAGGLFTEAYLLDGDSVVSPAGDPLYRPHRLLAEDDAEADRQARKLVDEYIGYAIESESEKVLLDLALARRFPFARDLMNHDEARALLFASSPLFVEEVEPDLDMLLHARWIGVLNRIARHGRFSQVQVAEFLARVDRFGAKMDGYAEAVRVQEEGPARTLDALKKEGSDLRAERRSVLHRNRYADSSIPFFVRVRGANAPLQVLAVDPVALRGMLDGVVDEASGEGRRSGLERPRILDGAPPDSEEPSSKFDSLPGYSATVGISPAFLAREAAQGERSYWYIIAFSVAGILAGGFLTARVVRRELKLAKLKSGFVSNVSHELKTPLTSIRMFTEMLQSGQVKEEKERQECLKVISQESERLVRLIQRVLDFSSLDARKRRFTWTTATLDGLVRREVERFLRATGLEAERLAIHIASRQPVVQHDPDAFAEVLSNLLSNAYKYSPAHNRLIEITLGMSRGRLALTVEDNGPGVAPAERAKIFEQFYRADDYLTRDVEGTGLGLSIVRSIVRAHGGRILVEDREGGGSRFMVILPVSGRPIAVEAQPAEARQ